MGDGQFGYITKLKKKWKNPGDDLWVLYELKIVWICVLEKRKWKSKEYGYELGQEYVCVKFGQVKIGDVLLQMWKK